MCASLSLSISLHHAHCAADSGGHSIYDPVGMINASLKVIAWNGRAVVVGFAAGTIEKVRFRHTSGPRRVCR